MNGMRRSLLAATVLFGGLGVAASTAQAQGQAVAAYPRGYVAPRYPSRTTHRVPTYRRQFAGPRYAPRQAGITPHSVHDWSTGNENLPLAKPWLHNFR